MRTSRRDVRSDTLSVLQLDFSSESSVNKCSPLYCIDTFALKPPSLSLSPVVGVCTDIVFVMREGERESLGQ